MMRIRGKTDRKKKRKVEADNRQFLRERTDLLVLLNVTEIGALPVCSICQYNQWLSRKVQM